MGSVTVSQSMIMPSSLGPYTAGQLGLNSDRGTLPLRSRPGHLLLVRKHPAVETQ